MRIVDLPKITLATVVLLSAFVLSGCGGGSSGGGTSASSLTQMGGGKQGVALSLTGAVSTLAGTALSSGTTDGTGSAARFNRPYNVTTDGTNLYVTDNVNNTVRKIVISTGAVTTLAGSAGLSGSTDGTGAAARFNFPNGITTDGTNLYVADTSNNAIRKIVISTGVVTTLSATVSGPSGITTDGTNLYLTEGANSVVRQIVLSTGVVTTLAGTSGVTGHADGTASAATFNLPYNITTDGTNLYVADTINATIRKVVISSGVVTTVAGTALSTGYVDATGAAARFNYPDGMALDGTNLYVGECTNQTVRKVVLATSVVTTLAGTASTAGHADGVGTAATFNHPCSVASDGSSLFVVDTDNFTIRKIQ